MRIANYSLTLVGLSLAFFLPVIPAIGAEETVAGKTVPAKVKIVDHDHHEKELDLANKDHQKELMDQLVGGNLDEVELIKKPEPLSIFLDLGLWTIVVFVLLLIILRKMAWGPMLEGLKAREQNILGAVEEAKVARAETQRISAEFKVKMDEAYAEIPKIMAEARRDADAFKEETRAQTAKEMQVERQRLRREIETAKDQALQELWNQATQLATLMSAKVIGRSLPAEDHRRLMDEALVEIREAVPRR